MLFLYSIDVNKVNYLPPFFNDLFCLLTNCFLIFGCVNIPDTIGWFSITQLRVGTRTLWWVDTCRSTQPAVSGLCTTIIYFQDWIDSNRRKIRSSGEVNLFDPAKYQSDIKVLGKQISSMASKPINIRWIITGYAPHWKIMNLIV